MPRLARIVVPGLPHHITQRGNRRQRTFFRDADYELYLELMAEKCDQHDVEIWAYCLMSNHIHLIAVPETVEGLARAIGEAHRRYTTHINTRKGWTGYLWQGRFSSVVMDDRHLLVGARYVELNPVRAKIERNPWDYRWSSVRAHRAEKDDRLVRVAPLLEFVDSWTDFLAEGGDNEGIERLRRSQKTGRPLGDEQFIKRLERITGRTLLLQKPGPKPKGETDPFDRRARARRSRSN